MRKAFPDRPVESVSTSSWRVLVARSRGGVAQYGASTLFAW